MDLSNPACNGKPPDSSLNRAEYTYGDMPSYMDDVKPLRGFIPPVETPQSSRSAQHGYFKLFLDVEGEEMTPVIVQKPQDTLTIQKFVAVPGKAFRCRIELKRLPPEGVLYGCRVYIDKGGLDSYHEVNINDPQGINNSNLSKDEDHFFWIGKGKTAYTV